MNSFENRVKAAINARAPMRTLILDYLATDRAPRGTCDIAPLIGRHAGEVRPAIVDLIIDGKLVRVGTGLDGRPLYRPVDVGACDWCGKVDHHLVVGECPSCIERRAKVAEQLS